MLSRVWYRLGTVAQFVSTQRVRLYLLFLISIVVAFTVAFHGLYPVLEGRPISWIGSLLFVVETLSTTGYGDLLPFSNELTSLVATLMMATGVVLFFMAVPVLLTPFIARVIRATPPRRVSLALRDHVVCIGYDDTVRALLEILQIGDVPVVVVERDEGRAMEAYARRGRGASVLWGDPALASTRSAVSLDAARFVVVVGTEQEAANTLLAVRESGDAEVIAVVDDLAFDRYLRYAGASYVLSPKQSTGRMLARHGFVAADVQPVADPVPFASAVPRDHRHDQELLVVKAPVPRGSPVIDRTLAGVGFEAKYGVFPLLLWRAGRFTLLPEGDAVVDANAMLFLVGSPEGIAAAIEHELRIPAEMERRAVIAGFGDVGAVAYRELAARGIACTVIDPREHEVPIVVGQAEDEGVLKRSGIEDAQLLVVAVNDDAVNIFTTLMARNLNPDLKIVARANHPGSVERLYRAGADYVALQPTIGGQVIAGIVLADHVRILLDLPNGQRVVQRRWMHPYSRTVAWLEGRSGAVVIGVEGAGGAVANPSKARELEEGDRVMLVGGVKELRACLRLM